MPMVDANGTNLHYDSLGSGTPMLFIHGAQPDGSIWSGVREQLANDAWVITYDRRGFSRSSRSSSPDYRVHASDAADLLAKINAQPAVVVGWSWGGLIALELAATHPDCVRSLVLVEPAVHLKKHPTFSLIRTILSVQLLGRTGRPKPAVDTFFRWALARSSGGSSYDNLPAESIAVVHRNADSILCEIAGGTGESMPTHQIASIACPVTTLIGDLTDPVFRKAAIRINQLIPHARASTISGAGHAVHLDQPDQFISALRSSLA